MPGLLSDKADWRGVCVEERWFGSHLDLRLSMCRGISSRSRSKAA